MEELENKKKIEVKIDHLVPGMVIAQSLFNHYGALVIYDRSILNEYSIKKLHRLGYEKVYIYDLSANSIRHNRQQFSANYDQGKLLVKNMIKEVGLGKPVDMDELRGVASLLLDNYDNRDIINTLSQVRKVNEYIYSHCTNVALLCSMLAKWLKFDPVTIRLLTYTGLLHDIGKTKISNDILEKPEKLTPEEFNAIKKHPIYGYEFIKKIPSINQNILLGVLMHHEREDGSGYPMGLKGDQIHYFAKIVAICDIYDAMTSDHTYKNRQTPFDVLEMFENKCFDILDPKFRMVFTTHIANYYTGDLVKLNTGETAEIIHINPHFIAKPLVRVYDRFIDLSKEVNIKIVEMVAE